MNFKDAELLSAYLDGQLRPSDSARLEARLKSDPDLRAVMDDLRAARGVLRKLPQRRAPRNFTLTPKMAGLKPPQPRAYPVFRLATVLAALLFVASVAVNGLAPVASAKLSRAAAPAYGLGGGCADCGVGGGPSSAQPALGATQAPAATQPAAMPFTAILPTETPLAAQGNTGNSGVPTVEAPLQAAPPAPAGPQVEANNAPNIVQSEAKPAAVPLPWEIGLAGLAIIFGVAAASVRVSNERKFRQQFRATADSHTAKTQPRK